MILSTRQASASEVYYQVFTDVLTNQGTAEAYAVLKGILQGLSDNGLLSARQADLLEKYQPIDFKVTLRYNNFKLTFEGITFDVEDTDHVINKWKYLEDLIYSDWKGAKVDGTKLFREWTTNSETLTSMVNALMNDLRGKPNILDVYKIDTPANDYVFGVKVQ